MGFIDNALKALRLLGGRRYTNDSLNTAQEAFARTIDIGSADVFSQDNLIPTSSLPFSGSTSQQVNYQVNGKNIMKYWYRQRLTKSNTSTETWFFMSPIGAANGVTPQLIQTGQQNNFISPKYSVSSLANANTEDGTPGYGVKVFKSTSTNSGSFGNSEVVSTNDYQFDYKTGVVQFDQNAPSSNQIIYMTAYQYVGETLATGITIGGDATLNNILPNADDTYDIGAVGNEFNDLFIDGTANIDTLSLTDDFTYGGVTFNEDSSMLSITGSKFRLKSTSGTDLFTLYNNSDELTFQVDDKVVVLGARSSTPTAVAGGLFYSGSDQWFLGYDQNTPPQ